MREKQEKSEVECRCNAADLVKEWKIIGAMVDQSGRRR